MEQRRRDRRPLGVECAVLSRPAGSVVPIAGVAQVALDPMQIGVNPRRVAAFPVLHELVRRVPVTLGGVP